MPKTEACPHCSKTIDLAPMLSKKHPLRALVNPAKWGKAFRMVEDYDQITCPHCQQKYQTKKARFFGFVTPKHMAYFLLIVPVVLILLMVFRLIDELGFLFR